MMDRATTARCIVRSSMCALVVALCLTAIAMAAPQRSDLSIIPKLSGFGTATAAGSGRHLISPKTRIFLVTTLNDSGVGSLRACAEARGPRTCIPLVGGVLPLTRSIRIRSPYITIAGQTAPSPGLTLTKSGISVETHDVLIQHISIRPGDSKDGHPPGERDGISIGVPPPRSAFNVVIDHVSLTWAVDENISTAYPLTHDITIAHSIIAQGLHNSIHPKGPHSKGLMIGDSSKRITIRNNLIAFNEERNPYLKPGAAVEFMNNVVYGWGSKGAWSLCNLTNNTESDAPISLSFVGNVYLPGPTSFIAPPLYAKRLSQRSRIFARDNVGPAESIGSASRSHTPLTMARASTHEAPISAALDDSIPAYRTFGSVLPSAGARPADRDPVDALIAHQVTSATGTLKDCTSGCARATGSLNRTIHTYRSLRLPRRPFEDRNGDGYTNLENWLHRFATTLERVSQRR